jgi:peptide/nickel transport system ATP-binding protein
MTPAPLLSVDGLEVTYRTPSGDRLSALHDVSFQVHEGEIVGIVGESGCGKTTLTAALLRLLPPNGQVAKGQLRLRERDLLALPNDEMRQLRGRELAMVFQDPLTSLNPTFTIGTQMVDAQRAHQRGRPRTNRKAMRTRAAEMLGQVGIPDPTERLADYPHQFSGGMRQRIAIATALLLQPSLLIADEPTSSLDVTLEAQILALLEQLRRDHGTAILLVSHDLGVIAQICDRVVVMYAGRTVEEHDVASIFQRPLHPYTRALLASVPARERRGQQLASIPGRVPALAVMPPGCTFAERCPQARPVCRQAEPAYVTANHGRVRCAAYDPRSGYET